MSIEEENKATLSRFYDLYNQKQFDECNTMLAPDFISHRTTGDITREELISGTDMLFNSFPDFHATIEHIVAEDDMVAFREICRGTHQGDFMSIPATGIKVEFINTCILKIVDGKWAEAWPTIDMMGLMQQLGAIPS